MIVKKANKIIKNMGKEASELAELFYRYIFDISYKEEPNPIPDDYFWAVVDEQMGIYQINDLFVNFNEILTVFRLNIPPSIYLEWYDYSLDKYYKDLDQKKEGTTVNLETYFKLHKSNKEEK